jgi:hypothetical protein
MQEQLPRDVFKEPTGMYLWRVSEGRYTCRGDRLALVFQDPSGTRRKLGGRTKHQYHHLGVAIRIPRRHDRLTYTRPVQAYYGRLRIRGSLN